MGDDFPQALREGKSTMIMKGVSGVLHNSPCDFRHRPVTNRCHKRELSRYLCYSHSVQSQEHSV